MKKKLISFFIFCTVSTVFVLSFISFAVKDLNSKNQGTEVEQEKIVQIEQFLQEFYAACAERQESIDHFFLDNTISFYSQDDFFKGYNLLSYIAATATDFFNALEEIYKATGSCIEYTVDAIEFVEAVYDVPKTNLYYVDIYVAHNTICAHHHFYITYTASELKIYRFWIDFIR